MAVLALGLGLALSTTMFGVIDAVLDPASPYRYADRLVWLSSRLTYLARPFDVRQLPTLIRKQTRAFDASVLLTRPVAPASAGPDAREFPVTVAQPQWFDVVGVRVELGRRFIRADGDGVALVSREVWQVIAGGGTKLAGAHIIVGDRVLPVIGVLPRGAPPVLVPMVGDTEQAPAMALYRLAPGVTLKRAQAELAALARTLTREYGAPDAPWSLQIQRTGRYGGRIDDVKKAMVLAALAVLLIACVNLAHLMLARGLARRRELAVRMAIGASRTAALRLVVAESLVLLSGGVALGALGAAWMTHIAQRAMPPDISWVSLIRFQLSWRVFAVGAVAATISGLLFGLGPAVRIVSGVDLTDPLKTEAGSTTGRGRRYSPLVIGEVALALALMMGGGLLLRSVHQLQATPLGFEDETLIRAGVYTNFTTRWSPSTHVTDTVTVSWPAALDAVRSVPGVLDAAFEGQSRTAGGAVSAELTGDTTRVINTLEYRVVSPTYLEVHGLPILKGRGFASGDATGNGVAVLSTLAAARLYPRQDAVGHMLKLGSPRAAAPWIPIVGVARTPIVPWEEQALVGGELAFWVVRPPSHWYSATLLIRARTRDPRILIALRSTLRAMPQARFISVEPYDWERQAEIASRNFLATVFLAMGGVGLALAALGLYGVLAYAVTRRLREFAVRIALGAEPGALYRMVMHDGLVMLLAGTGTGAFIALASAYMLNAVLIGVYPTDALSLVVAEAVLLAVGLVATLAPARRAAGAEPLDILRAV